MKVLMGMAAIAAMALSGCATIIQGTSQDIAVTTPPVSGANCILTSKEGNWVVVTPGVAHVEKSKEDVLIKCSKDGYQDASAVIPSDFQAWTAGNIIAGGLIGVGVDAATGAMNEYPKGFAVPMQPVPGAPMATGGAPAPAAATASSSPTSQRACTQQQAAQKRIAIENHYSMVPNCS